jgi:hypothetical protein
MVTRIAELKGWERTKPVALKGSVLDPLRITTQTKRLRFSGTNIFAKPKNDWLTYAHVNKCGKDRCL